MTDEEKFEQVCIKIESGMSLRTIFSGVNPPMSNTLFYRLIKENANLNERYARAKEIYASDIFDEIIEIADEANADLEVNEKGQLYISGEAVQRSRLKIDARKWILSKLEPKKYGDKIDIDHTTNGQNINFDYSRLSDAALEELAATKPDTSEG